MLEKYKYQILLHFVVLILGGTGVLGKLITLGAYHLVWYRLIIALGALGLFFAVVRYRLMVERPLLFKLLGAGVLLGVHWILFFEAIKRSNVSVTLVCLSTAALFTAFIEPIYFRRRIAWREPILGAGCVGGLYFVFRFEFEYVEGMAMSIASAALAGWFTVLNGRFVQQTDSRTITFYELLGALFTLSLCLLLAGGYEWQQLRLSSADLGWLLVLGIVCTAVSFLLGVEVIKRISPYSFMMAVNLEPIYAIVMAVLIWPESETMSKEFYFSGGFVVAMISLNAYLQKRCKTPERALVDSRL